ncbi:hypothetical protein [Streptomyces sp. SID13726]|uniref:hypothetical protein n=1 Tax=Streptomyces sp. SID13726 TaxID=2706058 RepID=UPI0013B803E8|nr:hypothetical protein [Streptomyces sp. SID13726]NEB04266.1 hypothetical protein [Streptomyces sp. SID13726]
MERVLSPAPGGGVLHHDVHVARLQGAADAGAEQVDLLDEVEGPYAVLQPVEQLSPVPARSPRTGTVAGVENLNSRHWQ